MAQQTADMVCSQQSGCVEGKVSSKAGVVLSLHNTNSSSTDPQSVLLLPGTYLPATISTNSTANSALLGPFLSSSTSTPQTGFSLSPSSSSNSAIQVTQSFSGLLIYSSSSYSGSQSSLLSFNDSFLPANVSSSYTPLSFLLSSGVYVTASVLVSGPKSPNQRLTFWTGVPDTNELPLPLQDGKWTIQDLQGGSCSPACGSGGTCSLEGKCLCSAGFTGDNCSQCQDGHYGQQCTVCPSCTSGTCDQGIAGTGRCIPNPLTPAAEACQCTNGVCGGTGAGATCECMPGWTDAVGGNKCSACQTGFYLSSDGECLACGPGCTACAATTGACSTCQTGLQVSSDNPQSCITQKFLPTNGTAFTSCQTGFYLSDASTGTCTACSAACGECFGPGQDNCLACAPGRGLLQGVCVAVDAGTGICDGSAISAGNALAWVYNNQKKECDSLPPGCTAGSISGFSSASTRANLQCTNCLSGLVLSSGQCLEACPQGFFPSSGNIPTCEACSSGCTTCEGTSDYCTSCPTGQLAVNGACQSLASCPTGSFQANTTSPCTSCHPDCQDCFSTFDSCTSCPTDRPVFLPSSKTCVPTCSSTQYLDPANGQCESCDSSCGTCIGQGSSQCTSCNANTVLKAGVCVSAGCGSVIPGYGLCLQDLAVEHAKSELDKEDSGNKKLPAWIYAIIAVGILLLLLLLLLLWRMRAVKKRMENTQGFQAKKGLFSFLRSALSKKGATDQAGESKDKSAAVVHNHIELLRAPKSPTPPPYEYPHAPYPAFFKQRYMFPPSPSSESNYSVPGSHHNPAYLADSHSIRSYAAAPHAPMHAYPHDSMPSVINWPAPMLKPTHTGSSGSSSIRPLMLRGSSSTASVSKPADRRHGTSDLAKEVERSERQKTLDLLTGDDGRGSGSFRMSEGLFE